MNTNMFLTWLGHRGIKLQSGDTIVLVDPNVKDYGFSNPRVKGAMVLLSEKAKDLKDVPGIDENTFIVDRQGEYEVNDVLVNAIDITQGDDDATLFFRIKIEEITIAIVSGASAPTVPGFAAELLEECDILVVSAGNPDLLSGSGAAELATKLQPKIVIPVEYSTGGVDKKLKDETTFIKEISLKASTPLPKLTIKKKDFTSDTMQLIMLEPGT